MIGRNWCGTKRFVDEFDPDISASNLYFENGERKGIPF